MKQWLLRGLAAMFVVGILLVLWWACGVVLEWVFGERGR